MKSNRATGPWSVNRDKLVRVGRTPVGKGLFAKKRFQASNIIGEIEGELIDDPNYGSNYCLDIEDGRMLEPQPPFRYVNHSCEPNCYFDIFDVALDGTSPLTRRVFLIASREIKPGEELTIDYNWPSDAAIPCRCRAPSCRGWIVSEDQLEALTTSRVPDAPDDK